MEQRRTVLLADTSTEFRILLREAMEKTGEFWVDVAQTGDEVLEKVQEQEPDILIMDVILPGLDGLSALRELQELGYAPMTILTSAFVSDQTLAEATELGAAYFLPKPFRMDTLLDRMRNLFWEKPKATRPSLKARVTHMLHDAGMPANISGYQFLHRNTISSRTNKKLCHTLFRATISISQIVTFVYFSAHHFKILHTTDMGFNGSLEEIKRSRAIRIGRHRNTTGIMNHRHIRYEWNNIT